MSERIAIAIRVPKHQLEQIDREAAAHQLSRTDYLIRSATGELPNTTAEAFQRIEALENAVQRLQEFAYATS